MIYELLGADGGNQQMKSLAKNLIEQLKMEITNKSTIQQQQPEEETKEVPVPEPQPK